MVQRDKNHPSIIIWSLGNEAGNGVIEIRDACVRQGHAVAERGAELGEGSQQRRGGVVGRAVGDADAEASICQQFREIGNPPVGSPFLAPLFYGAPDDHVPLGVLDALHDEGLHQVAAVGHRGTGQNQSVLALGQQS